MSGMRSGSGARIRAVNLGDIPASVPTFDERVVIVSTERSLAGTLGGNSRSEAQRALELVLEFCRERGIVPEAHTRRDAPG